MLTQPSHGLCLADAMIAGGTLFSGWYGVAAMAASLGLVAPAGAPLDWNGMNGFVVAMAALAAAIFGGWVKLTEIRIKRNESDAKIAENQAQIEKVVEEAAKTKREADAAILAAKADADAKIAAAEAKSAETHAAILAQNAAQQAEIDKLRRFRHDAASDLQGIKHELEAAKSQTADRVQEVHVTNTTADPVPIMPTFGGPIP